MHMPTGNAIATSNGAGPHNLQTFILAPDGTVMHCLPGYWNPSDLVSELQLGQEMYKVWTNKSLTRAQKDEQFRLRQHQHLLSHSPQTIRRSKMQSFDQKYEAKNRLTSSDTILDSTLARVVLEKGEKAPFGAFKTTDQIMHNRMQQRPFRPYQWFDVVAFTDYGRPFYNKNEDQRTANGEVNKDAARAQALMGNTSVMRRGKRNRMASMSAAQPGPSSGNLYYTSRGIKSFGH